MRAGTLNLPVIWRGCDYTPITMVWKDRNGNPYNLAGFEPVAQSLNIDFHPQVVDALRGVTQISLTKEETITFKMGVECWDWLWIDVFGTGRIYPPYLRGTVTVKEPIGPTISIGRGVLWFEGPVDPMTIEGGIPPAHLNDLYLNTVTGDVFVLT